jgi:ribose-phosphate pyrophosphokinase
MSTLRFISGSANLELSKSIASYMGVDISHTELRRFADGEIFIEIKESIRGMDVYIVQPTCPPVNENLMELLIIIDACKRASARSVNAVIPYFGYSRQDRKVVPRTPISARLVCDMLEVAGVSRVISVDLHSGQLQGFLNKPFDNIYAAPVIIKELQRDFKDQKIVVVSPDAGGVVRARWFADRLNCGMAIVDKRRSKANEAQVMHLIGDVKDSIAIIVDDMIDTAGTLCSTAKAVKDQGATKVISAATHGVFSGPALTRIKESVIDTVYVTDTMNLSDAAKTVSKIKVLSVASLMGEAIRRINNNESVSSLFI